MAGSPCPAALMQRVQTGEGLHEAHVVYQHQAGSGGACVRACTACCSLSAGGQLLLLLKGAECRHKSAVAGRAPIVFCITQSVHGG